jgi:hemerythrin
MEKDEYSVGILEIDNQHKLLLRHFSDIEDLIISNQGWLNTHYAIVNLAQRARMHFSFEEALMRLFAYPGLQSHQNEHQYFFAKMDSIEKQMLKKSAEVEMVKFLSDWLKKHILGSDRNYAEHIFSGAQIVRPDSKPSSLEA